MYLQPIYGIGGERILTEEILDHLAGFAGTKPVRIGNAAFSQSQHDVIGEMVLCLDMLMSDLRIVTPDLDRLMDLVSGLVEQAIVASGTTDTGLWEYRTSPRFHTFSQVLCWVAAHRGARLARDRGQDDPGGSLGSVGRCAACAGAARGLQPGKGILRAGPEWRLSRHLESAAADAGDHRRARSAVRLDGRHAYKGCSSNGI